MATTNKQRKIPKAGHSTPKGFTDVMDETTREMPYYRRIFSRFIHLRWVAYFSSLLGSTVARPNAILFGAIASFSLTLIAYLLSKNLGYRLSGFEPIGAFLVGWVAGILFDVIASMLKNR